VLGRKEGLNEGMKAVGLVVGMNSVGLAVVL